jgi:cobalamin synthase
LLSEPDAITDVLAIALTIVFAVLAIVHIYWSLGGIAGKAAAIPQVDGEPALKPSRLGTFGVAVLLSICAAVVLSVDKLLVLPVSPAIQTGFAFLLALLLFARAIGDFRLVGFFKRVRDSRFADRDTWLYSPLCLALSAGVFIVTYTRSA